MLVAEPDQSARQLYEEQLRSVGFDVLGTGDGRDALVNALVRRPALVLTEIRVPYVDGPMLCEILRQDPATRPVPIMVVTSERDPNELERARNAGANTLLAKPVAPDALLSAIRDLLAQASARRSRSNDASAPAEIAKSIDLLPHMPTRSVRRIRVPTITTMKPEELPPPLRCPTCDRVLTYSHSHIGGVRAEREQWDYLVCEPGCGRQFQYRPRTRKVRRIA